MCVSKCVMSPVTYYQRLSTRTNDFCLIAAETQCLRQRKKITTVRSHTFWGHISKTSHTSCSVAIYLFSPNTRHPKANRRRNERLSQQCLVTVARRHTHYLRRTMLSLNTMATKQMASCFVSFSGNLRSFIWRQHEHRKDLRFSYSG